MSSADKKKWRDFGFVVGGIFIIIGLGPLVFHKNPLRLWAFILGLSMILPAVFSPFLLKHPYRVWMFIGHLLGWFNTRVILGIFFFLLITPLGFLMRLFGYQPMMRFFEPTGQTYRIRADENLKRNMERQF